MMAVGVRGLLVLLPAMLLGACGELDPARLLPSDSRHGEAVEAAQEARKGPHRGRLLEAGDFTLELAIVETGLPPEFRAWATRDGQPLAPESVVLSVTLTRLGGRVDRIRFTPQGDALRGDGVIHEPHSFVVTVEAVHDGATYRWQYDSFEGRTRIDAAVARALGIETEIAGPVVMQRTVGVYGRIRANSERVRRIHARFDGTIRSVYPALGERVRRGQTLASVEGNESLQRFDVVAPISGVITRRDANAGEQTAGRQLFTIVDTASVWVELSLFPADLAQVGVGAAVAVTDTATGQRADGRISRIDLMAGPDQSVKAWAVLDNAGGGLRPGRHVRATITVGEHAAALAVKRSGLQSFRDFTVVYAQVGEEYEVRMLDLGLRAGEWVEVLGGLEPGTRYVSRNSYAIKADIEKSGAAHDH